MAYVLIQHKVAEYATFVQVFIDDLERRKRLGAKKSKVFRNSDDPHHILVLVEWDNIEGAKEFAQGLETREAFKWAASGLTSTVVTMEEILQAEA